MTALAIILSFASCLALGFVVTMFVKQNHHPDGLLYVLAALSLFGVCIGVLLL